MTHDANRLEHNRALWALVNSEFTDADADTKWSSPEIRWGLFGIREAALGVLGDVAGARVAELGCGTAYFSAWLARAGAHVVAVDLSEQQLSTARRCQQKFGVAFPLVEADAEAVPLRSGAFDLVLSEYGASPWCDPARWLREAARILRPEGRLVFLTNSWLVGLCVPAAGGFAGRQLLRSPNDTRRIEWPGGGIEHHPSHGEWIGLLRDSGFVVDALHELYAPAGAATNDYYAITTRDWAGRWPAEDLWAAHRPRDGERES